MSSNVEQVSLDETFEALVERFAWPRVVRLTLLTENAGPQYRTDQIAALLRKQDGVTGETVIEIHTVDLRSAPSQHAMFWFYASDFEFGTITKGAVMLTLSSDGERMTLVIEPTSD